MKPENFLSAGSAEVEGNIKTTVLSYIIVKMLSQHLKYAYLLFVLFANVLLMLAVSYCDAGLGLLLLFCKY